MSFNLSSAPFSSASAWNQQAPTGATYTKLNWPTSTGWNYGVTWAQGSPPVYVASSTDPVVQVSVPASWGWPGGTVSVHVPAGATGGGGTGPGSDTPIVVIDGDTVYNFWQFNRTSNTTATAQAYGEANVVTGTGWGGSGKGAGITAAGSSELGGLLVQAQTDTGTIDHALQLAVDTSTLKPGYMAPAIGGDGTNSNGFVQEGELLAIAPGTPMPSGLSTLSQEVFRALQQYGAYVTDNGNQETAIRAQANGYSAATMSALQVDLNKMLPLLEAVSGGSPTTPVAPTLTVADHTLSVSPGGKVSLGIGVSVPHAGDNVSVNISGLPKYETITDNLDHKTFSGSSVTLTAAEINSGLSLSSSYRGNGHPTATLTVTAHDATGTPVTSAAQTITVKDPPAVTTSSGTSTTTAAPVAPTLTVKDPPAKTAAPTKPFLSVEDKTLSVNAGGKVDLGVDVSTTDKDDVVSVNIKGLPRYETITDHLDGHTFRGKDITLTAAEVESGLTLNSHYRGSHHLVATLAATATAKDPVTGAVATSATQTITVKDPPATTAASGPTKPVLSVEDHTLSVNARGKVDLGVDVSTADKDDVVSVNIKGLPRYETITDHLDGHTFRGKDITLTAAEVESGLMLNSHYRGSHHPVATLAATATAKDPVTGAVATSATQTITVKDPPARTAATSPSHADHDFALLNQYLAGGRGDHGQIAMATSHASSWLNELLLTRPQH